MKTNPTRSRSALRPLCFAAATAVAYVALLVVPGTARASVADCTAAKAAATLQSKTPFHATYIVAPTTPGAFPTEHHEETWVNGKMYLTLGDQSWHSAPMPNNPMEGFTGPLDGFSDCRPVPAVSIRGETTTGYDVKMESGRRAKIYISPKSGLPVRDLVDQDILLVTLDFDYANVRAPAAH